MDVPRLRIRQPHSHGGLLALAATIAAIMALPVAAWRLGGSRLLNEIASAPEYSFAVIMLGLLTIPALATFIWIVRQCQHVRWVAAAGAVYGFTLMLFTLLAWLLDQPWLAFSELLGYAGGLLIPTILGVVAALTALLAQRIISYRIIEQDGTLCDRCGYPAARSQSPTCPECGHTCDPGATTRSDRLIAWFARRGRWPLAGLAAILILGFGLVLWSEHDYRTLGRSFGGSWEQTHSFQTYRATPHAFVTTVVYVELERRPAWKPHVIHIGFGHLEMRHGMSFIDTGDPRITVRVPITHARSVLRNGPPQQIIDRLHEAVYAEEWQSGARWRDEPGRQLDLPWRDPDG